MLNNPQRQRTYKQFTREAIWMAPVSYTHLDVYKRQDQRDLINQDQAAPECASLNISCLKDITIPAVKIGHNRRILGFTKPNPLKLPLSDSGQHRGFTGAREAIIAGHGHENTS